MISPIVLETKINAPRSVVWNAWTTKKGAKQSFAPDAEIELKVDGKYEIYFDPDQPQGQRGSEGCKILSFLPEEMLSFSWNAPPSFPIERTQRTWVFVQLEALDSAHTRVRLTHLGWREGGRQAELKAYFTKAWPFVLQSMEKNLGR